jgi:hypothetical protein
MLHKFKLKRIPLEGRRSRRARLFQRVVGLGMAVTLVSLFGAGLMLGSDPAAAGIVVDPEPVLSPFWVDGIPQFIGVVPFSDADVGNPISDTLTIRVPNRAPVVGTILEPANDLLPEHALLATIANTNWLFGPIAFPLGPDVPAEDWIILYNVGFTANAFFWSDPFVDPPDAPPPQMIALLPPDVAAALVTGPSIDQNADGTYTLPLPPNNASQAPEPSSLLMIATGLLGLAFARRRKAA